MTQPSATGGCCLIKFYLKHQTSFNSARTKYRCSIVNASDNFEGAYTPYKNMIDENLGIRSRDFHWKLTGITQNDLLANSPVLLVVSDIVQPSGLIRLFYNEYSVSKANSIYDRGCDFVAELCSIKRRSSIAMGLIA